MIEKYKIVACAIFLTAVFTGCEDLNENQNTQGIHSISYGTSFGECLGYCWKSITITPSQIQFTKRGWEMGGSLPDSTFHQSFTTEEWDALIGQIDLDKFLALDSVIGCPDCADGGAEWVKIVHEDQIYKVTFEYLNAPKVMNTYIDLLRDYQSSFE